jgi:hypothetical protein
MGIRNDLEGWIIDALKYHGGQATITEIAKHIWQHHQAALTATDQIQFNWHYDMRRAAETLRNRKQLRPVSLSSRGTWAL